MLMFVKADLIIPHYLTFYQMEQMKARGEKGPLFTFVVSSSSELSVPFRSCLLFLIQQLQLHYFSFKSRSYGTTTF